jgi:hypothetical protein
MPREDLRGVEILVAARDANFLRLAAAILTRAGHTVHTTADRLGRVERFLRLDAPGVLVLEADHHRILEIRARVAAIVPRVAIVLVVEDAAARGDGADAVVAKWGPPTKLLEAVRRVRTEAADGHGANAPRLRLVEP